MSITKRGNRSARSTRSAHYYGLDLHELSLDKFGKRFPHHCAGKAQLNYRKVPAEGIEPTHPCEYQILSLARLPVPPRRLCSEIWL